MPRRAAGWILRDRSDSPYWYVYWVEGKKERWFSTGVPLSDEPGARAKAPEIVLREGRRAERGAGLAAQLAQQLTLKQLSDQYIDELKRSRGEKYSARFDTDLRCYVEPNWSHPAQVTTDSWNELKTKLHGAPSFRKKPLTWRSIAHLANTLRHFLRWCHAQGAIASVPEIKSPSTTAQKLERAPRVGLEEEQQDAFLWALAIMGERRALHAYTTLFETWQRKGTIEALTLRWCDFRKETLTLPAQYMKGRKEKVVDLTPRAAEAILLEANASGLVELDKPVFGPFDFHQAWSDPEKRGGVFGRALILAGIWDPEKEARPHGLVPHHLTRTTALTQAGQHPEATLSGLMAQAAIDTASIIEHYMKPQLKAARRITRRRA
jgi:integrase